MKFHLIVQEAEGSNLSFKQDKNFTKNYRLVDFY